jgi:hypothetical protein
MSAPAPAGACTRIRHTAVPDAPPPAVLGIVPQRSGASSRSHAGCHFWSVARWPAWTKESIGCKDQRSAVALARRMPDRQAACALGRRVLALVADDLADRPSQRRPRHGHGCPRVRREPGRARALWGAFIQSGQAARVYSWIRPPSRSRRLTALLCVGATSMRAGGCGLGGLRSRLRCGRWAL